MTSTVENKSDVTRARREEAAQFMGVTYDPRIQKFTAKITINGKTRHLGTFETAEQAGGVYAVARADNPIERKTSGSAPESQSFAKEFDNFLYAVAERTGKPHGYLAVGEYFVSPPPDSQSYELVRVEMRNKKGKGKWVFYIWASHCRACGKSFETRTLGGKTVTGMTRNCADHRGARGEDISAPQQRNGSYCDDRGEIVAGPLLPGEERPYKAFIRAGAALGYSEEEAQKILLTKAVAQQEAEDAAKIGSDLI